MLVFHCLQGKRTQDHLVRVMWITFQTCKGNVFLFAMNLHNRHNAIGNEW